MGAALLLFAGCEEKGEVFYQNPYRIIVDYQPSTFTISGISGNVTPDENYDWITSNGNGSFTVRRNTSGLIRRAEFTVAGSKDKAIVNQRAHSLDATVTSSLASQGLGSANINVTLNTKNLDDYAAWGLIFGTANDRAAGKVVPMSGAPVAGINKGEITGLADVPVGGDQFDCDKCLVYTDAMWQRTRPFVFAGDQNSDYMTSLNRVLEKKGVIAVAENAAGGIVGYATAIINPSWTGAFLNWRNHPHVNRKDVVSLLKYTIERYRSSFQFPLYAALPLSAGEAVAEVCEAGFARKAELGDVGIFA